MINPFLEIDKRLSNIENLLLDIKHNPVTSEISSQTELEGFLTRKQALSYLGICSATLWRYEQQDKIKSYGFSGKRYFKKSEIDASLIQKK